MATIAEASREAPEAVYTCPGLLDRVLVRLEAAAVARALPAVVGKVTSVFRLIVFTCMAVQFRLYSNFGTQVVVNDDSFADTCTRGMKQHTQHTAALH